MAQRLAVVEITQERSGNHQSLIGDHIHPQRESRPEATIERITLLERAGKCPSMQGENLPIGK
tara:strand:- start:71 stop:259 length:189 start_codon:yes stop_codon:yes gene_type:complete